jgi:preprotein translocase subunit SecA
MSGGITLATNMAGRGTDIVLGGSIQKEIDAIRNDESLSDAEKVSQIKKEKVWPRPDYEALIDGGMQPMVARFIKQVYDGIAATPSGRSDAALKAYVDAIAEVRQAVSVPVIANGDVKTVADIERIKAHTGTRCATRASTSGEAASTMTASGFTLRTFSRTRATLARR